MKRTLSLLLASALLVGSMPISALAAVSKPVVSSAPAAEGTLDARLAEVTLAVKATLELGDDYTDFEGSVEEDALFPRFNLSWSGDGVSVRVTADETGKLLRYSLDRSRSRYYDGYAPRFPGANGLQTAQSFVNKLLSTGESVTLTRESYAVNSYYGTLCFGGLPSPVSVRVTLDETGTPSAFRRSDVYSSTLPEVPAAQAKTAAAAAADKLQTTVSVLPYYATDDDKTAVLRYLVESDRNRWIVTADDGKLVDLDALYDEIAYRYEKGEATTEERAEAPAVAADMGTNAAGASLSDTEQQLIDSIRDLLPKEKLDEQARAIEPLGLKGWTLEKCSYSTLRTEGDIEARLRYSRPFTAAERAKMDKYDRENARTLTKYVTLDARTGALLSVDTYDWMLRADAPRNAQKQAESFLESAFAEEYAETALEEVQEASIFSYTRQANGFFFPANYLNVRVGHDGTIASFYRSWTDGLVFDDAEGILSGEDALAAYMDAAGITLCYRGYPVLHDKRILQKYVLCYALTTPENQWCKGIDAKTGEVLWESYDRGASLYQYDDLAGAFARTMIEELAAFGAGLPGGSFGPRVMLDQKTMLALLLNADGWTFDPQSADDLDQLYEIAYDRGLLSGESREPDRAVTKLDFLRAVLRSSVYGETAKLRGVFSCPFKDAAALSEEDRGYAAIAAGLGMVRGDEHGSLKPYAAVTRQEAAVMLYGFLSR